ncbi:ABC transporter permease [Arthrobacter sulfonylureivorans]|uniref:ABC transporter permease n=1 Tax=Arthrobacter sulfonylureivorans TaxID=2486855 RepID=A0ABY3WHC9_9MICC|nr:ABC transporter permease [Arthrobacter sulfonylureivorans]UNK47776.1 ABC transporter permease [Arthrobacter sulfonylureivorans]
MRVIAKTGWQLLLPVSIFVAWAVWTTANPAMFFPTPARIWEAFQSGYLGEGLVRHVLPSLANLGLGLLIGVFAGLALGLILGLSKTLDYLLQPILDFGRAMPPPAILPFAILLLGVGYEMKVGLIAFGVMFPVLLNTIDGIRSLNSTMRAMTEVYRLPVGMRLFQVWLPAASPQILAGFRTSLAIGLLLMVVSEMVASTQGIGFFLLQSQRTFAIPEMWAGMLLLAIIGVALIAIFSAIESRLLHWHIKSAK